MTKPAPERAALRYLPEHFDLKACGATGCDGWGHLDECVYDCGEFEALGEPGPMLPFTTGKRGGRVQPITTDAWNRHREGRQRTAPAGAGVRAATTMPKQLAPLAGELERLRDAAT